MVITDPIYGEIKITPIEKVFIDSEPVQRLRRLSQVGSVYYVYPSATHTRFSHAIGTMYLAGIYGAYLFPNDYRTIQILRLAGLLHDIAHGPFSHQFDAGVLSRHGIKLGHDDYRLRIIEEVFPEAIKQTLSQSDEQTRAEFENALQTLGMSLDELLKEIINIFDVTNKYGKFNQLLFSIVQGPLGADRLDFLQRDVYFTGIKGVGVVDYERIIGNSAIVDGKLVYNVKIMNTIEATLFVRYAMYRDVYFHRASRAASRMMEDLMSALDELGIFEDYISDPWKYLELDDNSIFTLTDLATRLYPNDLTTEYVQRLATQLKNRQLIKTVVEIQEFYSLSDLKRKSLVDIKEVLRQKARAIKDRLAQILDGMGFENSADKLIDDVSSYITIFDPAEFTSNNVFIQNGDKIMDINEIMSEYGSIMLKPGRIYFLRVFTDDEEIRTALYENKIVDKHSKQLLVGIDDSPLTLF